MKILTIRVFMFLIGFTACGLNAQAISSEKMITYHIQLGDWPERLRPTIESVVEELVAKEGCWALAKNGTNVEHIANPSSERCSRFVRFHSEDALKPWKRNPTDAKYYAYFDDGSPGIHLKILVWDGKKLTRAANAGFRRDLSSKKEIRDLMVRWTMK